MIRGAIVNTPLGMLAQNLRDRWALYRAIGNSLETLGTLANDSLARHLLERLCLDGRVFIDVGAHIGSVIDGVRRHSRPERIIAIEAIPAKAEALRRRFPDVTVHCTAVGDMSGEISFFIDEKRTGYSSLDPALGNRTASVREIVVPINTLDGIAAHGNVDMIKIDVEGAELGVLRGAEAMVAASRPTVMFESGSDEMKAFPKTALWEWLDSHDYCVVQPNRVAHNDAGMTCETFLESHLYPRRTTNYFGIARERRNEVRDRARHILKLR
jgi:FkbM family methyltransferase